jgi:Acetyltransferases
MIKINEESFDMVYQLFEEAFILAELRPYEKMKELFLKEEFVIYGYNLEGKLAGAILVWEFDECIYLENFAVDSKLRNQGIGAAILKEIQQIYSSHLIVLEVEEPIDELTTRRVHFYQRHQFYLNPFHFIQPALRENVEDVHLMLMSYPHCINEETFKNIRDLLFYKVYKQNKEKEGIL